MRIGLGSSALKLATDATMTAKALFMTDTVAGTPLSDVTTLSYWTYQDSAILPAGGASSQLVIHADGDGAGFTTLVYEPY